MPLQILLSATDDELADAWETQCGDLPQVRVHRASILELECDAVVSPANSYGFMDGALDLLYSAHFGWHVQERLQHVIREKHSGELLVGQAEIVETNDPKIPFVISAPTMRVPMVLGSETVNPYLAARAALLLTRDGELGGGKHDGRRVSSVVKRLAFPGLGTGVGRVPPRVCARQVRAAIEDVIVHSGQFPSSWVEAQKRHGALYSDWR